MHRTFTLTFTDSDDANRSADALRAAMEAVSVSHGCEAYAKRDALTVFTAMDDLSGAHLNEAALACARNANRINAEREREYRYSVIDYATFFCAEYRRLQAFTQQGKRG